MSIKLIPSLLLIMVLFSCSESNKDTASDSKKSKTSVDATGELSEDTNSDLALENEEYNALLDSINMNNNSIIDFEEFQLVFFQYKREGSEGQRSGDTIFIEEEMGQRLEHFIIYDSNSSANYEVQIAYQQSIIAPTLDDKSLALESWVSITDFEVLPHHEKLRLDYTLPNYQEDQAIKENFKSAFEAIKKDALKARSDAYIEHKIEDTADISHLTAADNFNDLNLSFYNSKIIIKIIQTQQSGEGKEFYLVNYINWGC
jgi:hypothetical protein